MPCNTLFVWEAFTSVRRSFSRTYFVIMHGLELAIEQHAMEGSADLCQPEREREIELQSDFENSWGLARQSPD